MSEQKQIAHQGTEQIDFIAIKDLKRSKYNMRSEYSDTGADEMLKASIAKRGVMQNLIVHPQGKGYGVAGGGRRLNALLALEYDGTITKDYQVPCLVTDVKSALAMSVDENQARLNAHPIDEFIAYSKLVDAVKMVTETLDEFIAKSRRPNLLVRNLNQVLKEAITQEVTDAV